MTKAVIIVIFPYFNFQGLPIIFRQPLTERRHQTSSLEVWELEYIFIDFQVLWALNLTQVIRFMRSFAIIFQYSEVFLSYGRDFVTVGIQELNGVSLLEVPTWNLLIWNSLSNHGWGQHDISNSLNLIYLPTDNYLRFLFMQ